MTASIAIFGWVVLGLVTTVSLYPSDCDVDLGLTPRDDVLAGLNTPVFFFRANSSSKVGHDLIWQKDAMNNLMKSSGHFRKSSSGRTDINDECRRHRGWLLDVNATFECEAPSTIYPRIVVIIDNGMYQRYDKNLNKLLKYVLAYWNGVDLLFRTLEHPKLRLNIAGIVVEERADELPFLAKRKKIGNRFPTGLLIQWLKSFTENNGLSWSSHFGSYHVAGLMASFPTCFQNKPNECVYDDHGIGFGLPSQMCKDVDTKGPPIVLFFHENGNWMRTRSVARLIEKSIKSHPNREDAYSCGRKGGWAMDVFDEYPPTEPDWSPCYLDSFKKRFNRNAANCFFDKPKITSPLPRVLLGQVMTGDDQCEYERGTYYCMRESICQDLLCHESDTVYNCVPIGRPAADGTICGDEKICYRRQCVPEMDVK